ncbi:MAG: ABC-F family ATP-binding cassette domain-containing protein [Hyphomicrobiaceae bacterium]|nr:ABC-F family ATP-binding cassette domain-containing protein [Hyphomicrobiaceae bacterium]
MLHINDLTYRIEGKPILEGASVGIPTGHKVGLVGRNGAGKSTLIKLIAGDIAHDDGAIRLPKAWRLGMVAQEAPGGEASLLEWVLAADVERASLLAEADTATDPDRIAAIHERLGDIDAHAAPARAAAILAGLGFDEAAQARACRAFSGGWRMRVALAAVLFLEPDVLLLDEPTNYLDLEGTLWLESYLKAYPHTVLLVSHDRDLLNRAVQSILHLERGKLTLYPGGYDDFEEARREQQRLQSQLRKRQDEERKRIQAFIDRFKAKATKARQAQSRVKALAKMKPIAAAVEDRVIPFALPNPKRPVASPLLRLEGAAVGYGEEPVILSRLDLRIDADDRIALLGQNGNGKSTFAKLISGRLRPREGRLYGLEKIEIGYFAQHQLDDLVPSASPYDYAVKLMPEATEAQKRTRLGTWGFSGDKADTKCQNLSGGEKARLLIALTAFHGPNLLILDEPTNHLDVDSREALVHALSAYEGAVILISHDRHLIEATADRLWVVAGGTVTSYEDDLDAYRDRLLAERGARPAAPNRQVGEAREEGRIDRTAERRLAAQRRAEVAPLKKIMQAAEARVEAVQARIAALDARLADAEFYVRDPSGARKAAEERGLLAKDLAVAEEAWMEAAATYEAAAAVSET